MKTLLLIGAGVALSVSSAYAQPAARNSTDNTGQFLGAITAPLLCSGELASMEGEPDYDEMMAKCKQRKMEAMRKVGEAMKRQQEVQRVWLRKIYGTSANGRPQTNSHPEFDQAAYQQGLATFRHIYDAAGTSGISGQLMQSVLYQQAKSARFDTPIPGCSNPADQGCQSIRNMVLTADRLAQANPSFGEGLTAALNDVRH